VISSSLKKGMAVVRTVADQFAEALANAGVKRIYGIVGDSPNDLTDAIRRQGKIEWIDVRHEELAAFAAGAEAHLIGLLAVCAGSGTGTLHLINGLFECHRSSIPVLAVAAHILSDETDNDYFEETHPLTLFQKGCDFVPGTESPDVKTAQNDFVELLHTHVVLAMPNRDKLVDAREYLCNFGWAVKSSKLRRMKTNLIISADTLRLETVRCWLLALVVKELVKNALRRVCFFGSREGKISIELTWEGSFVHCAVSDNGPGIFTERELQENRTSGSCALH
jgi:hypothetical protein